MSRRIHNPVVSQSVAKDYPRSLPFRPPDDLAVRETRLRRWTLVLVLGAGLALGLTIATAVFFASKAARRTEMASADKVEYVRPAPRLRDLAPEPADPNTKRVAAAVGVPHERMLEGLGGLAAAHLYQSYLNIGLLADGVENDVYTEEETQKLLDTVTALIESVDKQLAKLDEAGLKAEDQKALERTRQLTALLRTQLRALRAYWETADEDHALQFHTARDRAWTGIKELLSIAD